MQKLTLQPHEIIVSSAIQLSDGSVYTGTTHKDCLSNLLYLRPEIEEGMNSVNTNPPTATDGFITSRLRFVSSEEAAKIAYRARQIKEYTPWLHIRDIFVTAQT